MKNVRPFIFLCVIYAHVCVNGNWRQNASGGAVLYLYRTNKQVEYFCFPVSYIACVISYKLYTSSIKILKF